MKRRIIRARSITPLAHVGEVGCCLATGQFRGHPVEVAKKRHEKGLSPRVRGRREEAVERIVQQGEEHDEAIREERLEMAETSELIGRQLGELEEQKQERRQRDSSEPPEEGDTARLQDAETTGDLVEVDTNRAMVMSGD